MKNKQKTLNYAKNRKKTVKLHIILVKFRNYIRMLQKLQNIEKLEEICKNNPNDRDKIQKQLKEEGKSIKNKEKTI